MTPKEKFELYERLMEEEASTPITPENEEKILALREQIDEARRSLEPFVGMKCSIVYWSDIRAATVTDVEYGKNGKVKACTVTHNKVKCIDWFGNEYEILPELQDGRTDRFTIRKNGRWYGEGQKTGSGSVRLMLHYHCHSIDPSY